MLEKDDGSNVLFGAVLLCVAACVVCAMTCAVVVSLKGAIDDLKGCVDSIAEKDQTTRETLNRLSDTLVRLEAVQEAQKGTHYKTFDVRDFPPVEDEPTICTPDDLDDDPTDPYKPGVPANAGAEPEVQVSTSRLLRI